MTTFLVRQAGRLQYRRPQEVGVTLLYWAQQTLQPLLHLQVIYLLWYQFLPRQHTKRFQLIVALRFHLNKLRPHNSFMFTDGVISVNIFKI